MHALAWLFPRTSHLNLGTSSFQPPITLELSFGKIRSKPGHTQSETAGFQTKEMSVDKESASCSKSTDIPTLPPTTNQQKALNSSCGRRLNILTRPPGCLLAELIGSCNVGVPAFVLPSPLTGNTYVAGRLLVVKRAASQGGSDGSTVRGTTWWRSACARVCFSPALSLSRTGLEISHLFHTPIIDLHPDGC